ncbi:hypothetical protein DUI87_06525 [Hirundo rustica rustica]|uniref:Uncharacterized protein n=1 Tax=Hirundo rustica rustica TaxID=333673 RepID=A0A3M0KTQ4_HIRRU|nr:hypothetical protein DUI87_06525 [Hirundo rustica rustica]
MPPDNGPAINPGGTVFLISFTTPPSSRGTASDNGPSGPTNDMPHSIIPFFYPETLANGEPPPQQYHLYYQKGCLQPDRKRHLYLTSIASQEKRRERREEKERRERREEKRREKRREERREEKRRAELLGREGSIIILSKDYGV